jgi:hypothetical protein
VEKWKSGKVEKVEEVEEVEEVEVVKSQSRRSRAGRLVATSYHVVTIHPVALLDLTT